MRQVADGCKRLGSPEVEIHSVDMTSGSSIDSLCEQLLQQHGHIDVLVNNAGMASWEGQGPIEGALQLPTSFLGHFESLRSTSM